MSEWIKCSEELPKPGVWWDLDRGGLGSQKAEVAEMPTSVDEPLGRLAWRSTAGTWIKRLLLSDRYRPIPEPVMPVDGEVRVVAHGAAVFTSAYVLRIGGKPAKLTAEEHAANAACYSKAVEMASACASNGLDQALGHLEEGNIEEGIRCIRMKRRIDRRAIKGTPYEVKGDK